MVIRGRCGFLAEGTGRVTFNRLSFKGPGVYYPLSHNDLAVRDAEHTVEEIYGCS